MSKWTEVRVLGLPSGEDNSFERKGAKLLDLTLPGAKEMAVREELAKQLSAFANTGGGSIIYGVDNQGRIDNGGITRTGVHGSVKDWLEDVIPHLTEPAIPGFQVIEMLPEEDKTQIAIGKVLIIVEVPNSDSAPHQSVIDQKYYVRLGGKSRPARHQMIEDIRNRRRNPVVDVTEFQIEIDYLSEDQSQPGTFGLYLNFRLSCRNSGQVMARSTCLKLAFNLGSSFLFPNVALSEGAIHRPSPIPEEHLLEIPHPIYPGMAVGVAVRRCYVIVRGGFNHSTFETRWRVPNVGGFIDDTHLHWTLFAESAPPRSGSFQWATLGLERLLTERANLTRRQ